MKYILESEGAKYFTKHNEEINWLNKWFFHEQSTIDNSSKNCDTITHRILRKFLETADQNACRPKGGYRHDEKVKSYASYLRFLSEDLAYETLQKNLPHSLPSLSTTNRFLARAQYSIIESELRCDELLSYLVERNLPLAVSISEDATRVVNRVQYDSKTNQLIGFVLPLDNNGLPISFSYKARSAVERKSHFSNRTPVASFINVVMAKTFGTSPTFCLLAFGSDGKYTSNQVEKRWTFIKAELKKRNIIALVFSSDADPKFCSTMKRLSHLGCASTVLQNTDWFKCRLDIKGESFYVQDTPHNGTKMRNWFCQRATKKISIW